MIMKDLKELTTVCETTHEIIVYGAGRVSYALLQYLAKEDFLDKVFCVMVSEKKNNPDNVLGIPVCSVEEVGERKDTLVLVATFENVQEEICEVLKCHNYEEIRCVSNILYAEIRRECRDFQADVMQNTQMLRKEVRNLKQSVAVLQNHMSVLTEQMRKNEICYQAGVIQYDELIPQIQYKETLENWYRSVTGEKLDLNKPRTFNEKIQWIKLYGDIPMMTRLADKYLVRKWVTEKIGEEYLIPLLGVWNNFSDITIDDLPEKFVLKCNHGSGWNEIVKEKEKWDINSARKRISWWMNMNYAYIGGLELQYRDIQPKIIAEQYLELPDDEEIKDYKLFVFAGKVELIQVDIDRSTNHRRNLYTKDWELLPCSLCYPMDPDVKIEKPKNLSKMIRIAEILAKDFPHVRVDLYIWNEKIYFGEMTFTHGSGIEKWSEKKYDMYYGDLFVLKTEK